MVLVLLGMGCGAVSPNDYDLTNNDLPYEAPTGSAEEGMIYIPAGYFYKGCEGSRERVFVEGFFIDKFEVSISAYVEFLNEVEQSDNGMYVAGMQFEFDTSEVRASDDYKGGVVRTGSDGSYEYSVYHRNDRADNQRRYDNFRENYPIIHINYDRASAFCQWKGKRLPTAEEWEKAARGGEEMLQLHGYDADQYFSYPWLSDDIDSKYANYGSTLAGGEPIEVGNLSAGQSVYGVYNMSGNVKEVIDSSTLMGGSYSDNADTLKVCNKESWGGTSERNIGFRCAK